MKDRAPGFARSPFYKPETPAAGGKLPEQACRDRTVKV